MKPYGNKRTFIGLDLKLRKANQRYKYMAELAAIKRQPKKKERQNQRREINEELNNSSDVD